MAASENAGATIASTNKPGWHNSLAVSASTLWLKPRMPPKALWGSPSSALRQAAESLWADAPPQGLLCLITTADGRAKHLTML